MCTRIVVEDLEENEEEEEKKMKQKEEEEEEEEEGKDEDDDDNDERKSTLKLNNFLSVSLAVYWSSTLLWVYQSVSYTGVEGL